MSATTEKKGDHAPHIKTKMKVMASWGPRYSPEDKRFLRPSNRSTDFFYEEVHDFLRGEEEGRPVYPCRLSGRKGSTRPAALKAFKSNCKKSYKLMPDGDGEYVLIHKVAPGKGKSPEGDRSPNYGWKVIPRMDLVPHIIAQVRETAIDCEGLTRPRTLRHNTRLSSVPMYSALSRGRKVFVRAPIIDTPNHAPRPFSRFCFAIQLHSTFHFGRDRALEKLNATYLVHNESAESLLTRAKAQCPVCCHNKAMPPNPPHTPIISADFGERILIDLKNLGVMGYIVVAICHWSNWCRLGHILSKTADEVTDFLLTVFAEVEEIRGNWKAAQAKAAAERDGGGPSRPVNKSELDSIRSDRTTIISLRDERENELKVKYRPCLTGHINHRLLEVGRKCDILDCFRYGMPHNKMKTSPEMDRVLSRARPVSCCQDLDKSLASRIRVLQHDNGEGPPVLLDCDRLLPVLDGGRRHTF